MCHSADETKRIANFPILISVFFFFCLFANFTAYKDGSPEGQQMCKNSKEAEGTTPNASLARRQEVEA